MSAVEVAKQDGLRARRQGMLERASVPSAATKHSKPQTVVIKMFLVRVAKNKKKSRKHFQKVCTRVSCGKKDFHGKSAVGGKKGSMLAR